MNTLVDTDNKILFVDDEENVLSGLKRRFHNRFAVETASNGQQALDLIRTEGPFAVVVSDFRMDSMDGLEFLCEVKKISPDSVCMMLTGRADIDIAARAVNESCIYRFITKPCPDDTLAKLLQECVEQYNRVIAVSSYTYTAYIEDGQAVLTERSKGCLAVTGHTAQDFVDDNSLWYSMILPEYRSMVRNAFDMVIAGHEVGPVEFRVRKYDGQIRWIRDTIIPQKDEDGIVLRIKGLIEDITERKEMEENLRQSQIRYKRIVANVPGLVFQSILCTDGTIEFLFVSESCRELFGLEPEQVMADSKVLLDVIHPADRAEYYKLIAESAEKLCSWQWQGRALINGETRWYHGVSQPERLEDGSTMWDGLLLDITEQKRIEQQAESLARFPNENPYPVIRVLADGEIIYANKASVPLLELWGKGPGEKLPDELVQLVTSVNASQTNQTVEIQCRDHIFSIVFTAIHDADYVNLYACDITEIKHAEMELIKANTVLSEHDRLKSEFVSTVSHELRTPLCIFKNIVSNAMAGVMGKVSYKLYESLKMADRSIDRLSRIIGDFLDISKIESGNMKLDMTELSMQSIINEVIDSVQVLASAKGIEFKIDTPRKELMINADHDRIAQVLTNIVGNAIKFIPVNGHIEVSLKDQSDEIEIAVKDDGPGLSKEEIEKVFDRFVQIHLLMGPGEHGTGLGLTIAKELVEMHGGRIWAESKPGQGCCFKFILPKAGSQKHDSGTKKQLSSAIAINKNNS